MRARGKIGREQGQKIAREKSQSKMKGKKKDKGRRGREFGKEVQMKMEGGKGKGETTNPERREQKNEKVRDNDRWRKKLGKGSRNG